MMSLGCFVLLFVGAASAKKIVVTFPDRGPAYPIGTITLTQNKGGPLKIETNLQRLENSDNGNAWHGERQPPPTMKQNSPSIHANSHAHSNAAVASAAQSIYSRRAMKAGSLVCRKTVAPGSTSVAHL